MTESVHTYCDECKTRRDLIYITGALGRKILCVDCFIKWQESHENEKSSD